MGWTDSPRSTSTASSRTTRCPVGTGSSSSKRFARITPTTPSSTITVGDLDDGFYVEDDGPGIPADEREAVFDAGYSTSDEGIDFGLSIVEQVAEAQGWEVRVTEGNEGGARFELHGVESYGDERAT